MTSRPRFANAIRTVVKPLAVAIDLSVAITPVSRRREGIVR
jgi:hypothetical protein